MTDQETPSRSILIVAGESSGETHAAGLVRELRARIPPFSAFGSGGEQMASEGVELMLDVSALAAIGPWAALAHAHNYLRLYRQMLARARQEKPDLAILVDFPDFNLRLARRLKSMGIPVCYFISPQVWAWRPKRVKQIRRYIDLMLVILPFEEEFFRSHGVEACYVGNPSASRLARLSLEEGRRREAGRDSGTRNLVALLPGSREKEVEQILPVALDAAGYIATRQAARFCLIKAPAIETEHIERIYQNWMSRTGIKLELDISEKPSHADLSKADCAIVKSGTSTLEAMLLEIPFAMVYRISFLSWLLLRPFVRAGTYCLANLVAGKQIVPEFVQKDATGERIGAYMVTLLSDPAKRMDAKTRLAEAKAQLGTADAYDVAARQIAGRFFGSSSEALK